MCSAFAESLPEDKMPNLKQCRSPRHQKMNDQLGHLQNHLQSALRSDAESILRSLAIIGYELIDVNGLYLRMCRALDISCQSRGSRND